MNEIKSNVNCFRLFVLHFIVISGLWNPIQAQPHLWKHANGPFGGLVSTVFVHGEKVFAGGYGGIFVGTNEGLNWRHVGPYTGSISSIISANSYLFASTSSAGVYRSSDEGETWINTSEGLPSPQISKISILDSIVFAGTNDYGIFRSSDWGKSWLVANNGIDNLSIRNLCTIENVIIASAAGASGSGMFRSIDYGQTWIRLDPDPYAWNAEYTTSYGSTLYGVDFENQAKIHVCTDYGKSWILPMTASAPDDIIYAIYADDNGLFAGSYAHGIFCSRDRTGSSWQSLNNGITNMTITAFAGDSHDIYAGTWAGVNVSSNSGNLWNQINSGLNNSIVMALSSLGDILFAGTWGNGIMFSTDQGKNWQASPSSPDPYIFDLYAFNGTLFALVGVYPYAFYSGELIFASTNAGRSWLPWGRSLEWLSRSLAANSSFVFSNNESGIYRTDFSGQSWIKILDGNFQQPRSICALGSVVLVANGGTVMRSTDNGNNWTSITVGGYGNLSILSIVGQRIFAGSTQVNNMYVSNDLGMTWQGLSVPLSNADVKQIVGDGSFVAAGLSSGGGVIVSYDSGNNWIHYNLNLSNSTIQSLLFMQSNLYAGTWGNGVFFAETSSPPSMTNELVFPETGSTNNSTRTLLAWNAITDASAYQLQISESATFDSLIVDEPALVEPSIWISIFRYSTKYYWRVRGKDLNGYLWPWVNSSFQTMQRPDHISLSQNYPNPFRSSTQIRFDLPSTTMVTIKIYNLLGQLVETLESDYFLDGVNIVTWNSARYSSGVYFLTLQTNESHETIKMLMIK